MKIKNLKLLVLICFIGFIVVGGFLFFHNQKEKDNEIPIAMALDDGYIYPTIVAMTSVLENANSSTKYSFYIMHPSELSKDSKNKLKSVELKYKKCSITLIDMEDKYKSANSKGRITTPTYYRLSLPDLLPKLKKIIWLDGDTLTFKDLKEMYDIDMTGKYYKGFLDDNVGAVDNFTNKNDHCICAGVMLVNLEELRKDNMVNKCAEFIEQNNEKLIQHDQTTINALCYEKIGILPAKFGIYSYESVKTAKSQANLYRCKEGYSEEELENAYNNPVILHCISKPWKSYVYTTDIWREYAKKTDFFSQIKEKYPII